MRRTATGAACVNDEVKTQGTSAGAIADVDMFNVSVSAFSAKGLGSVLMQDIDALDASGRACKSEGS